MRATLLDLPGGATRTVLTLSSRGSSEGAVDVAMLQVVKNDSTLRHVKELIFEYNQQLLELGCDVGSFQVSCDSRAGLSTCMHGKRDVTSVPPRKQRTRTFLPPPALLSLPSSMSAFPPPAPMHPSPATPSLLPHSRCYLFPALAAHGVRIWRQN